MNLSKSTKLFVRLLLGISLFLNFQIAQVNAQDILPSGDDALTYKELITALNSKLPNKVFKSKAQVITFLIAKVKERMVDKPLTKEIEDILRDAGATNELISVIKQNSPALPIPKTEPKPSPKPPTESKPPSETKPTPKIFGKFTNSFGIEFVKIPSGRFMMGSNSGDSNEKPVHEVQIKNDFYLGKYEVTQKQWKDVMGSLPEEMKEFANPFHGDNLPIIAVSWKDAQKFIDKLNDAKDGYKYSLPSEEEWEYAARAGTVTKWSFGDNPTELKEYEWYIENANGVTKPVGQKRPNTWGLYDMQGNVFEWCRDSYIEDYKERERTIMRWYSTPTKVAKGGSAGDQAPNLRPSLRRAFDEKLRNIIFNGFRVAATPK